MKRRLIVLFFVGICVNFLMTSSVYATQSSSAIVARGSRNTPKIALTFDADMTPLMKKKLESGVVSSWYNSKVIDVLTQTHTPATLFLTGMWSEVYPDETKSFAANPLFELANHSYSHPGFTPLCFGLGTVPDAQKKEQVIKTQQIIHSLTGITPHYFRFPGGCYAKKDLQLIQSLGLTPVQWDVIGGDAFSTNTKLMIGNMLRRTHNGSIIVLHMNGGPNAPDTAEAIAQVIPTLRARGYRFVTLSELLGK